MEASALILAAGAGTRMKSSKPKVAHQIFGKPLVRWVVDAAHAAGIDSVVGVVGHGREQVEPLLTDVTTVVQEEQLGTAHAVHSKVAAVPWWCLRAIPRWYALKPSPSLFARAKRPTLPWLF